jgi:hypothetical protein
MNYYNITVSAILSFNEPNQITHLTAERYYEKGLEKRSGLCDEYREINGIAFLRKMRSNLFPIKSSLLRVKKNEKTLYLISMRIAISGEPLFYH